VRADDTIVARETGRPFALGRARPRNCPDTFAVAGPAAPLALAVVAVCEHGAEGEGEG
jgi:hypothetical protein